MGASEKKKKQKRVVVSLSFKPTSLPLRRRRGENERGIRPWVGEKRKSNEKVFSTEGCKRGRNKGGDFQGLSFFAVALLVGKDLPLPLPSATNNNLLKALSTEEEAPSGKQPSLSSLRQIIREEKVFLPSEGRSDDDGLESAGRNNLFLYLPLLLLLRTERAFLWRKERKDYWDKQNLLLSARPPPLSPPMMTYSNTYIVWGQNQEEPFPPFSTVPPPKAATGKETLFPVSGGLPFLCPPSSSFFPRLLYRA